MQFTDCPDEALAWINKSGVSLKGYEGFTASDGGVIFIYAPNLPILAHEALHAAIMILDEIGDESRDEEVTAYLVQFIFDKCSR